MELTYTHDCKGAKEHNYNINVDTFITNSKRIDPITANKVFSLELDNGQLLKLRPAKIRNVLALYQGAVNDSDEENIEETTKNLFDTITSMIESVDGIADKDNINEWVRTISAGWVHDISDTIEKISDWGPDFNAIVKCKDCEKEMEINTPINPLAFFI